MNSKKVRETLWLMEFSEERKKLREEAEKENRLPDYAGFNLVFWNKIYKQGREEVSNIVCGAICDVMLYIYSDKIKRHCLNCQKIGCEHSFLRCRWMPNLNWFMDLFKERLEDKEKFNRRTQNEQ